MQDRQKLSRLLVECFPTWSALHADDCWVWRAIERDPGNFRDAIAEVTKGSGRTELIARLSAQHPIRRVHQTTYDDRVRDVMVEALAFAWTFSNLGPAKFIKEEGATDLQAGNWYVEAKHVWESDGERSEKERLIQRANLGVMDVRASNLSLADVGLIKKFQYQLEDALKKWDRQERRGKLAIFYSIEGFDFGVSHRQARTLITNWASQTERLRGVSVVVCDYDNWREPIWPLRD